MGGLQQPETDAGEAESRQTPLKRKKKPTYAVRKVTTAIIGDFDTNVLIS